MSKAPIVDILMYHSIATDDVATAIAPDIFKAQMDAVETSGTPVITLDDYVAARNGEKSLPPASIIITFDDAFVDFQEQAFPILSEKGFPATVYVPTGCVGGTENWRGALQPPRHIMSWSDLEHLAANGIQLGSHTISHPDLNELKTLDLIEEVRRSKQTLEDRVGKEINHFAPPYGIADYFARTAIERLYQTSVGTSFERATLESDIIDLPRLEMFYFKKMKRWEDHLAGKGKGYMTRRRTLRQAREAVNRPWERV